MSLDYAKFIPLLPACAAVICGICCFRSSLRGVAAVVCIGAIAAALGMTLAVRDQVKPWKADATVAAHEADHVRTLAPWLTAGDWITATPTDAAQDSRRFFTSEHDAQVEAAKHQAARVVVHHYRPVYRDEFPRRFFESQGPGRLRADGRFDYQAMEPDLWRVEVPRFSANFSYFFDPLTVVMLTVVTGVGLLVSIYAAGYMRGDRGYARFFAYVSLFIFAMTTLVMADNLVLLYLGWEGVGLCSYLLIGFYYDKPSAVAAAKKAFIVNRIGDVGFLLGIFFLYQRYGYTLSLSEILKECSYSLSLLQEHRGAVPDAVDIAIPFLLMLGAFGKSAQIPLYVWLPDAMEGPTPVSALIHAATMVTAGVYMIARLLPVFETSPYALPTVAVIGAATALFAATIALCQYDIKRIYAYSTISQLGYMFLGVGVASSDGSAGGIFHLFTHAFFKALLFLTAGSVMHAMAGQLDLRKMSGLGRKMPVTAVLMLIGCLALAGFPLTAGFYSKDMILAAAMERGLGPQGQWLYLLLGIVGLVTAFTTAFYCFRVWFRIFVGPLQYEMGAEHQGTDAGHGPEGHEDAKPQAADEHGPHEVNWLMNAPLVVLAVGALLAGALGLGWIADKVGASTAAVSETAGHGAAAPLLFGHSVHESMLAISSVLAVAGIALAAYFHWFNRAAATRVAARYPGVVKLLENKYYIDELYDAIIVRPLYVLGQLFYLFDRLVIDGLVAAVAFVPRLLGRATAPSQHGRLQGYALGMAAGVALVVIVVLWAWR